MASAAQAAARRARRAAAGLCSECEDPRLPDHPVCQKHLDKRQVWNKARKTDNKATGRCDCGDPIAEGHTRCDICLEVERVRQRAAYRDLKVEHRCVTCRKHPARKGYVTCKGCSLRSADRYEVRKERLLRRTLAVARKGQLWRVLMSDTC